MKQVFKNKYGISLVIGLLFFFFCFIPTAKAAHRPLDTVAIHLTPTTVTAPQGGSFTITFTLVRQFMGVSTFASITPLDGMSNVLNQPAITACSLATVGSSCTRTVTYAVLTNAVPSIYNTFAQVTDGVSVQGISNSLGLTVTGTPRTLTVAKAGAGSGTITSSPAGINCGVTCSASFIAGTSITLTATASTGSVFNSWIAGPCFGASPTCTFTLLDNTTPSTTPTAQFDLIPRTLTVTKTGTGSGTVACNSGTCAASYPHGTSLTLAATPAVGSAFAGWSGGTGSAAGCTGTANCVFSITADSAITATFNAIAPSITAITPASGTQGTTVSATITGSNLTGATAVTFSGTGVTAAITASAAGSVSADITITAGAATGARTFTVTTPSGTSAPFSSFTVTAPLLPPAVTTLAAGSITETGATLNGSANPNSLATNGWFRYSTTNPVSCNDTFGTRVPLTGGTALGSGGAEVSYSQPLAGLIAGTTYYFCAIAQNSVGTGYGNILLFSTLNPPAGASYAVVSAGNEFAGWAWGGHVLGWLSFNWKNCDINADGTWDACGLSGPSYEYKVWLAGTLPNAPPVASNLQSTFLNRCSAVTPFEQILSFNYSDNEGDPMAEYTVNIYDFACDANKNQFIDTGSVCGGDDTTTVLAPVFSFTQIFTSPYTHDPAPGQSLLITYPYTGNELVWGKIYYFTVKVRDPDHLN